MMHLSAQKVCCMYCMVFHDEFNGIKAFDRVQRNDF